MIQQHHFESKTALAVYFKHLFKDRNLFKTDLHKRKKCSKRNILKVKKMLELFTLSIFYDNNIFETAQYSAKMVSNLQF